MIDKMMSLIKKICKFIFPESLWTESFTYWWILSLVTILLFDVLWMIQTTFTPFSFVEFWLNLFLGAFLLSVPSLLQKNGIIQVLWLLFWDIIFVANLMYCRTYFNAIPLHSYFLINNLYDFSDSVEDSFKWYFIFFPLLTVAAYFYYILEPKIKRRLPSFYIWVVDVGILIAVLLISNIRSGGIIASVKAMSKDANLSSSVVPIYSICGFLINGYLENSDTLKKSDIEFVNKWFSLHKSYTSPYWNNSVRKERKRPKNLIIILCESFESWPIGLSVEGKELTPNINRWLEEPNTFFASKVVTQTGSGRSIDGQLLIMAGFLPMNNDVYSYSAKENRYFSLLNAIKSEGGSTVLFSGDKPHVWNQELIYRAFGGDTLINGRNFVIEERISSRPRISDVSLMKQTVKKLKEDDLWRDGERKMIAVVTYSGHNPFTIKDQYKEIELNETPPGIIRDYMIAANYTDSSLPFLLKYLKERLDWEETMVVITGDHEGLAQYRLDAINIPEFHSAVDSLQHTPFIVINSPISGRYDLPLGQVDLYTSILDLMGLDNYEWKGIGWSIFDPNHPGCAINMNGNIEGEENMRDLEMIRHITDAKKVSDLILRFNLLEHYNDSIPI